MTQQLRSGGPDGAGPQDEDAPRARPERDVRAVWAEKVARIARYETEGASGDAR